MSLILNMSYLKLKYIINVILTVLFEYDIYLSFNESINKSVKFYNN